MKNKIKSKCCMIQLFICDVMSIKVFGIGNEKNCREIYVRWDE